MMESEDFVEGLDEDLGGRQEGEASSKVNIC